MELVVALQDLAVAQNLDSVEIARRAPLAFSARRSGQQHGVLQPRADLRQNAAVARQDERQRPESGQIIWVTSPTPVVCGEVARSDKE